MRLTEKAPIWPGFAPFIAVYRRKWAFVIDATKSRPPERLTLAQTLSPGPLGRWPMERMESDERWQELAALRDELDASAVVIPICVSRIDGKPHELSPKARRFAEALSVDDGWARISEARNRLAA